MSNQNTKPSASTQQWSDSEGLRFFCRHLVALCITYEKMDGAAATPHFAAYSGTLIEIGGQTFLLTAGHILRDLEKARRSAEVRISSAVLADTFGQNPVCTQPIPFDLKSAKVFYIDNEDEGLDFGVIALSAYYVRLLAANKVVALSEKNWLHQHRVEFDGYAMLGLPEEFTSMSAPECGLVSPTMFRVHRLAEPQEGSRVTRYQRFVGQIDKELPLNSVVGMSGGPIFGFKLEPQIAYWIVALQSTWIRSKRIVYGCSLPTLASLMTEWAKPAA